MAGKANKKKGLDGKKGELSESDLAQLYQRKIGQKQARVMKRINELLSEEGMMLKPFMDVTVVPRG